MWSMPDDHVSTVSADRGIHTLFPSITTSVADGAGVKSAGLAVVIFLGLVGLLLGASEVAGAPVGFDAVLRARLARSFGGESS